MHDKNNSENTKQEVLKNAKKIFEQVDREERQRLNAVFKEILEDPYYKENMLYYFKEFLAEKY
jgi:hypothetical protein